MKKLATLFFIFVFVLGFSPCVHAGGQAFIVSNYGGAVYRLGQPLGGYTPYGLMPSAGYAPVQPSVAPPGAAALQASPIFTSRSGQTCRMFATGTMPPWGIACVMPDGSVQTTP